jgi:hypothetical protein
VERRVTAVSLRGFTLTRAEIATALAYGRGASCATQANARYAVTRWDRWWPL